MTRDESARMDALIPSLEDYLCAAHTYEEKRACTRCKARHAAHEARIVAEPTDREAAVAEALTLVLSIAESAVHQSSNPFNSRRARFLVGWLAKPTTEK